MKRLIICAFVAVAFLAAATTMMWSYATSAGRLGDSAAMTSVQKLHAAPGVNKLPSDDYEDMSLVFSSPIKR
jgi:hypothetical protein